MSGPFVVNVRKLRRELGARRHLYLAGPVPGLSIAGAAVEEGAEVSFDGWLESTRGGVVVTGRVRAPFVAACGRCLEPASGVLEAAVHELCRDPSQAEAHGGEPGEEEDAYPVGPDFLDLQPIVHDACILELPLAPLCSDSCLGLCPSCGVNRNSEACSCEAPIDPRWSALSGLGKSRPEPKSDGRPDADVPEASDGKAAEAGG